MLSVKYNRKIGCLMLYVKCNRNRKINVICVV